MFAWHKVEIPQNIFVDWKVAKTAMRRFIQQAKLNTLQHNVARY